MTKNIEKKRCPRCQQEFDCNKNVIEDCQCSEVNLKEHQCRYIATIYTDCVCLSCLRILKTECDQNLLD